MCPSIMLWVEGGYDQGELLEFFCVFILGVPAAQGVSAEAVAAGATDCTWTVA